MDEFFYDIFSDLPRQGPGDQKSTLKATEAIKEIPSNPFILDVGCGTGKQTLELVRYFGGNIIAIDNHQPFLDKLAINSQKFGIENRITCQNADMLNLPFVNEKFDLIWAEGSIFIIGFQKGLETFKKLLKPSGFIALTEVSWFKESPPKELKDFWDSEYPDINTINHNLKIIESLDYKYIDHFKLPDSAWLDDYYIPLENRLKKLRSIHNNDKKTLELIKIIQHEIDIFYKYSSFYGYVFYIAQKIK